MYHIFNPGSFLTHACTSRRQGDIYVLPSVPHTGLDSNGQYCEHGVVGKSVVGLVAVGANLGTLPGYITIYST